jgi:hypothetical protein
MYTRNRLRRDTDFPGEICILDALHPSDLNSGAYLEFAVRNCSSVYLSLHNSQLANSLQGIALKEKDASPESRLNFGPVSGRTGSAPPVSLLSRVDHGEYYYLPQSSKGLVAVTTAGLLPSEDHIIRIWPLALDGKTYTHMQFEGLWLDNGGLLIPPPERQQVIRPKAVSGGTSMLADGIGHYSRQHLGPEQDLKDRSSSLDEWQPQHLPLVPRKTLEIVTDVPLATPNSNMSLNVLRGWDEMIGDMFDVDHVRIMLDTMCLESPCIRGSAKAATVKDAYFRRYHSQDQATFTKC